MAGPGEVARTHRPIQITHGHRIAPMAIARVTSKTFFIVNNQGLLSIRKPCAKGSSLKGSRYCSDGSAEGEQGSILTQQLPSDGTCTATPLTDVTKLVVASGSVGHAKLGIGNKRTQKISMRHTKNVVKSKRRGIFRVNENR